MEQYADVIGCLLSFANLHLALGRVTGSSSSGINADLFAGLQSSRSTPSPSPESGDDEYANASRRRTDDLRTSMMQGQIWKEQVAWAATSHDDLEQ